MKRIAVPVTGEKLSPHFGHCEQFLIADIENNNVLAETFHTPPAHAPGVYPRWLSENGVHEVIACGIGKRAIALFEQNNIHVHLGVPDSSYRDLIQNYLNDNLVTGENACDH
ncbi:MAG: NifB/NifX family molybdenum-iron cluster-binding protein [Bacteroidales bacterium]|nr:NifB/NifX family molybdenum-iron cluster-binding protein [Bacteroidales bacterium]MCF8333773.1 NifB/NifX family molybdenum-iron cluster-binding protein [Bacteroidales bacterium]